VIHSVQRAARASQYAVTATIATCRLGIAETPPSRMPPERTARSGGEAITCATIRIASAVTEPSR